LIPTFSPQGDGNEQMGSSTLSQSIGAEVDPYLFPARGRKRQHQLAPLPIERSVDPYLFPARGRKPH